MKIGIVSRYERKALLLLVLLGLCMGSYAATTGSITLSGAEQFNGPNGMWDAGNVTVSINGYVKTVPYGQYSTPDSIASAIAALFTSDCNGPANAKSAPGGVIYVQMRDGVLLSQLTANTYSSISFAAVVNSNLIQTTTTATIASTQLLQGGTTTVSVQVSCDSACGSVDYRLDGGEWGTIALDANGHFSAGTGSNWSSGLHNIVIVYQGNGTYAMSTSNPVSFMISNSSTPPPQPTSIYSYNITTFQANGNVSAYTDSTASDNETWSNIQYDGVNRLTAATQTLNGTTQSMCWGYDSFGNRTPQTIISSDCYSSPPAAPTLYNANNQNTTLQYDASGDVTYDGTNQYVYDAEGRICAVGYSPLTGGSISWIGYLYDADDRRVAKGTITTPISGSPSCDPTNNGFQETAGYVLGPNGEQLTEVDGGGNWQHTNVYAAGSLIATYDADGLHFHLDDWLGTRRVDTDYAGNPESSYHSLPFGEMVPSNQTISNTEHFFTGKERDQESGLDYFGARYYTSFMGRFMSPDWAAKAEPVPYAKLDDPQSLNLYVYVLDNPLISADASGHQTSGTSSQVLGPCNLNASGPFGCYEATIKAQQPHAPQAQQQSSQAASNSSTSSDPIATALSNVPGVASVTPAPDPTLDVAKGGHQNETDALTFKTPADQAKFLAESRRKHLVPGDVSENGYGPGVRLPGGLHAEHGRVDSRTGQFLVTSHIDRFNANNGLAPLVGHFLVDVIYGSIRYPNSAGLDH